MNFTSSKYILKTSREYSIYIAKTRAIPYASDGLKHGQRISLWLLKSLPTKIKTFALGGLMAYEKLYVHGDASANASISTLAAPYKNNYCLIEGLGQFGDRVAPDAIGAPRYTDVKRSKVAETILYNDSNLIPLEDNYDKSNVQPIHFLPLIPIVLLNGVSGIAVGWSTDILPHSLKDLIDATKQALNGSKIKPLVPHFERYNITIKALDKPNQWELSGKVEITGREIKVIEIPPGLSLISFREFLIDLEEKELIDGYVDRSTDKIDLTIIMPIQKEIIENPKTGEITYGKIIPFKMTEDEAIDFLKLRQKTTERIVVVDWSGNNIKQYSNPEDLVQEFAEWRLGWYSKRYAKYIEDDNDELIYLKSIVMLYQKKFPQKLGTHQNKLEMENEISDILTKGKIAFKDHHLNRIVNMATYRWTKDLEAETKDKIELLNQRILDNTLVMKNPDALKQVYLNELDAIDWKKL